MMLWKNIVGENRVGCFRLMLLEGSKHVDQKTGDEQMEDEGAAIGR